MNNITLDKPLNDTEMDRLTNFLSSIDDPSALNIEGLDGYFAALICSPSIIMPSEYLPPIWGEDFSFADDNQAQEVINLLMRHWNTVNKELQKTLKTDNVYLPVLLENDDGVAHGNDWAQGFLRGLAMRSTSWRELLDDKDHVGCLIPIMMLAHENHQDPKMRPKTILPEEREEILQMMIAGLTMTYRYFAVHREMACVAEPVHRITPKVGRNDLCPCGSGKKYKHCCGGATKVLH
jgi:uncharacterized protein